jgi:hypothetical protein
VRSPRTLSAGASRNQRADSLYLSKDSFFICGSSQPRLLRRPSCDGPAGALDCTRRVSDPLLEIRQFSRKQNPAAEESARLSVVQPGRTHARPPHECAHPACGPNFEEKISPTRSCAAALIVFRRCGGGYMYVSTVVNACRDPDSLRTFREGS